MGWRGVWCVCFLLSGCGVSDEKAKATTEFLEEVCADAPIIRVRLGSWSNSIEFECKYKEGE